MEGYQFEIRCMGKLEIASCNQAKKCYDLQRAVERKRWSEAVKIFDENEWTREEINASIIPRSCYSGVPRASVQLLSYGFIHSAILNNAPTESRGFFHNLVNHPLCDVNLPADSNKQNRGWQNQLGYQRTSSLFGNYNSGKQEHDDESWDYQPLELSLRESKFSHAKVLLESGKCELNYVNPECGYLALHYLCRFFLIHGDEDPAKVSSEQVEIMQFVVNTIVAGTENIDLKDVRGFTPLMLALGFRNCFVHRRHLYNPAQKQPVLLLLIKLLIKREAAKIPQEMLQNSQTVFHKLMEEPYLNEDIVDYLWDAWEFDKMVNELDQNGDTPLHVIAKHGKYKLLAHILQKDNCNNTNKKDMNLLYIIVNYLELNQLEEINANLDTILEKYSIGSDLLNKTLDQTGKTFIHSFTEEFIINRKELNKEHYSFKQLDFTTAKEIIDCQIVEIVKKLIDKGASVDIPGDNDGSTVLGTILRSETLLPKQLLHLVISKSLNNHETLDENKIVLSLLQEQNSVFIQDDATTPLHYIFSLKKPFPNAISVILMRNLQCNLDETNKDGQTILHCAVDSDHYCNDTVTMLLEKGVSIDSQDRGGKTALHYACGRFRFGKVILLLDHGASVYKMDTKGVTPLDLIFELSCDILISKQFHLLSTVINKHLKDINMQCDNGKTFLHYILKSKCLENIKQNDLKKIKDVISLVLEKGANVDISDKDGLTPLHLIIQTQFSGDVFSEVLSKSLDINKQCNNGKTALHYAIERGTFLKDNIVGTDAYYLNTICDSYFNMLKTLLAKGALPDVVDNEGKTALHYAVDFGGMTVCSDACTSDVCTSPFFTLIKWSGQIYFKMLKELLKIASVNIKDNKGKTVLHYAIDLWKSASKNIEICDHHRHHYAEYLDTYFTVLEMLLENHGSVEIPDNEGKTVLYHTIIFGRESHKHIYVADIYLKTLKMLLKKANSGDIIINDIDDITLLHLICCKKQNSYHHKVTSYELTKVVITKSHDVNKLCKLGKTALHYAIENRIEEDLIKLLLEKGACVDIEDTEKATPLYLILSWYHHNPYSIELLANFLSKSESINKLGNHGFTALHYAIMKCNMYLIELLLKKGACVDIENSLKQTPLHLIMMYYKRLPGYKHLSAYELVKAMINKSSNINKQCQDGRTALQYAVQNKVGIDIMKVLIDKGASVDTVDNDGKTLIHSVCLMCIREDDDDKIVLQETVLQLLIDKLQTINQQDKQGQTALHCAIIAGNMRKRLLEMLLEKGASVDTVDNDGKTLLHSVCLMHIREDDDDEIVLQETVLQETVLQLLIEKFQTINQQDDQGQTALHCAIIAGNLRKRLLEMLLEKGASVDIADKEGQTALHHLIDNGCKLNLTT